MIWVDGFKGTDKNMKCRDFQYELGKEFTYDGKLDLCSSGFHACSDLNNVFDYYKLDGENRFFRIKAFVPENYNENFNKTIWNGSNLYTMDTKFVASKIKFISECTYDDFKNYISWKYPMIENEEECKHLKNYGIFSMNKFIKKMINFGYSESFAMIISNESNDYRYILNYVQAFEDEDISKDLRIYMLIKKVEQLKKK